MVVLLCEKDEKSIPHFVRNYKCSAGKNAVLLAQRFVTLFLIPVVPDVLHVIVIFHDLDHLFHQLIQEKR
jgi:hypothetical protein